MNTFSIERGGQILHNVFFANKDYETPNVEEMTFEELSNYEGLADLVDAMLDATDDAFGPGQEDVFITLVDEAGRFIWSINIEQDGNEFSYGLIDWRQSDDCYYYEEEVEDD